MARTVTFYAVSDIESKSGRPGSDCVRVQLAHAEDNFEYGKPRRVPRCSLLHNWAARRISKCNLLFKLGAAKC